MFDVPNFTVFGCCVLKQKFFEHLDVSSEVKRLFVEQIRLITWSNKLSPQTMNIAEGQTVSEIEVFHIKLTGQKLDNRTLELMDKQIPYHILFLLERPDGTARLSVSYKEAAQTGDNVFRLRQSYATPWLRMDELHLPLQALDLDGLYVGSVRAVAGDALHAPAAESLKDAVEQTQEQEKLQRQLQQLRARMKKEKNLAKQMELRREIKRLEEKINDKK